MGLNHLFWRWFTVHSWRESRLKLYSPPERGCDTAHLASGPMTEIAGLTPGYRSSAATSSHFWELWPAAPRTFILQGCSAVLKASEPLWFSPCDQLPKKRPVQSWEKLVHCTDRIKCQSLLIPWAQRHQITRPVECRRNFSPGVRLQLSATKPQHFLWSTDSS